MAVDRKVVNALIAELEVLEIKVSAAWDASIRACEEHDRLNKIAIALDRQRDYKRGEIQAALNMPVDKVNRKG